MDTERVPAQHVRVRKEIVEEEVTVTVTLRHEELVIEREPIAPRRGARPRPPAAPRLDEPPIEIVLWAEEPVVSTRAVPVETRARAAHARLPAAGPDRAAAPRAGVLRAPDRRGPAMSTQELRSASARDAPIRISARGHANGGEPRGAAFRR